ncbi:MAG: MarR family transcriptional regulator [Chthoniobacter sp.]|uniref:MarR family winged helix-turn-helix transcriptional regulator n=1 Tax=Chthoniobacter sp. TaxID=2510640 RepID=UPI0032A85662
MNLPPRDCAAELLEVVPLMMRVIRTKVRAHSSPELSVPQFRALAFLGRNEGAMLGDVAGFLVLTLSATSKLIDGLVTADLVARDSDPLDRRKIVLTLTASGQRKFAAVRQATADFLTERVAEVSVAERACITDAMRTLRGIFSDVPAPETNARLIKTAPTGIDN